MICAVEYGLLEAAISQRARGVLEALGPKSVLGTEVIRHCIALHAVKDYLKYETFDLGKNI